VAPPTQTASWTAPDGTVWDLTGPGFGVGVMTLHGVAGIGAAPRSVSRRAASTGGGSARWGHATEVLVTWPVQVYADGDPDLFADLWRRFRRAFTSTVPPAGVPRPGLLRITRGQSWRELSCIYLDGLAQEDDAGYGYDTNTAVLSLVAPDPWWYGETVVALEFLHTAPRSYLDPYETVTPAYSQGVQDVVVEGDVDAMPVWTLRGPAPRFTVAIPGRSFSYGREVPDGKHVTVDVAGPTVVDSDGADRIGELAWPESQLFPLPAGRVPVTITIGEPATGAGVGLAYRPRYEGS